MFAAIKRWFKKPEPKPKRIRWIETRGCMAHIDYKIQCGTVLYECVAKLSPNDPMPPRHCYRIKLDVSGHVFNWPAEQFLLAKDGVLEYRY